MKCKLIISLLVLLIITLTTVILINYNKDEGEYYDFPTDYAEINCSYTVAGNINATCFITPKNDSIVVKEGDSYTVYNKKSSEVIK